MNKNKKRNPKGADRLTGATRRSDGGKTSTVDHAGPYRVMTFDGGGIRGVVTATLLQRLMVARGCGDLIRSVDFLAGTSTGGLIALALAAGMDPGTIRDLYVRRGPEIFDDSWWDNVRDLGRLRGAQYSLRPLRRILRELFGDLRLGDLNKRVLVTAFDLDNEAAEPERRTWKPKLFHNFPGPGDDRGKLVADVALYTCAAPTYFPSADGYIDGGVYANNPAMCALAQTQDARYTPVPPLERVALLSLGTGTILQFISGRTHDWGYAQWARPVINLMLDGTMGIADYQCRQLLGRRYHRLAPVFPPGRGIPMDAVRRIPELIRFAESWPLDETIEWIQHVWFASSSIA